MRRPPVVLGLLLAGLLLPSTASAATTVLALSGDPVSVIGVSDPMDIDIDSPAPNTIRVVDASTADELTAGPGCTEAPADTVTCAGLTASQFSVEVFGSTTDDSIAVDAAATFKAQLFGRGGNDVLLGGAADDRLGGGLGNDDIDGRGGSDLVENGRDNSNGATSDDDSDIYRDTGTTGQDSLNFGPQTVGVHLKVDGLANDGGAAGAEGDDVRGGFERLRGTAFDDVVVGGPAPEVINGSVGDDDLTGGPGADTIEGNEGVDTLRGRDGEADLVLDCDSASSVTQGTGETVFLDAVDPEPQRCEILDRLGGGGPTPGPGPTTPDPAAGPGTPSPTPGSGSNPSADPPLVPLRLGAVNVTEAVSRMPRVTGKKFAAARDEVLKVVAFAEVELEFKRGCKQGDFLEVTKQTPITGATLNTDSRSPAAITLVVCIAEADYLRDCDLAGVKADVKRLGNKALDADVALTVLGTVNRCKVDYDVKITKANEEAKIKLEAQRASEALAKADRDKANAKKQAQDKIKADLRANITCPINGPLTVGVIDGYTPSRTALGLKAAAFAGDPDAWTLPSNSQADYQSFIDIVVSDRGAQFPQAKVFLDTDDVTGTAGRNEVKTTKDGHALFSVRPLKAGFIKVCVVVETGADEVISTGLEIKVVAQPKMGTIYETQSGRRVKLTPDGPVAQKSAAVPAAFAPDPAATRANIFTDAWNAIVGLFSNRSQTVNSQASAGGENRVRTAAVAEKAKVGVGQVTLNGRLSSAPQLPVLNPNGRCFVSKADGTLAVVGCPVLEAPRGTAVIGASNDGNGVVAYGNDNVIKAVPQNTVLAGKGRLVGLDGGTLVGLDGGTLVGPDGGTLIGNDGSTLIGNDGSTLIGNDGSTLVGNDGASIMGALGASSLSVAPSQVIARDGAGLLTATAGFVPPSGLR